MKTLTSFQRKCEAQVLSVLKKKHLDLGNRRVDGRNETYIYGQVKGFEIWIYGDGAEIMSRTVDKRFEKPDFTSEDDLIQAFTGALDTLVS